MTAPMAQTMNHIPVAAILPNPEQPRREIDAANLEALAASIQEHGVIQPIAVEQIGEHYILHDGERRWRASQLAGKETIPAVIVPGLNGTGPEERLTRALVANIQREEMHQVDEALAIARLKKEFNLSNRGIARRLGRAEPVIEKRLQLASLDPRIQDLMRRGLTHDSSVVIALKRIEDDEERYQMAKALAARSATIAACKSAIYKYLNMKGEANGSPVARRIKGMPKQEDWPEWDALYQIDRVPRWQVVTEAAMATCDSCSLRPIASDKTCRDCALVIFLEKALEAVNGR